MADRAIILALDTTTEFGSVAVRRGPETVFEIQLHSKDGLSHIIFGAIEEVLGQANLSLRDVDCFAAASGPGSFTGVRVGLAAVKGLAEALAKPAVGISNLRALSLFGHAPCRAPVLDARRGQVYGAVYNAQTRIVVPELVTPWNVWLTTLPHDAELVGFENGPCQSEGVRFTVAPRALAGAVAFCAEMDSPMNWSDPVALDANYVRRSDAELSWRDG